MNTIVKRRGKRTGAMARLWVTMAKTSHDTLKAESEQRGLTIAALVRQLIDRALALGLLHSSSPPSKVEDLVKLYQKENLVQVHEELRIAMQENIDTLRKTIDAYERRDDHQQQMLKEYVEIITDQAKDIQFYEQGRVHDAADAEPPDVGADKLTTKE